MAWAIDVSSHALELQPSHAVHFAAAIFTNLTGDRLEFHSSLAHTLLAQALAVRNETRVNCVGLAGGVFQNRVLTEHALQLLMGAGFEVFIPKALPLNDAAISFGQIIEARAHHAATH